MTRIDDDANDDGLLNQVEEGMRVYDSDNADIGRVERVYLPSVSEQQYARGEGPATANDPNPPQDNLLQTFGRVFEPDNLPEELRERLLVNGFMRIEASGILASDRYVMEDQIDRVDDHHVILKVPRKNLIKS